MSGFHAVSLRESKGRKSAPRRFFREVLETLLFVWHDLLGLVFSLVPEQAPIMARHKYFGQRPQTEGDELHDTAIE